MTVIVGLGCIWYLWPSCRFQFLIILFITIIIFVFLIFRDADKSAAIKNHERLISINQHELDAIQQNLNSDYDEGKSLQIRIMHMHPIWICSDPFSIFQWLNRCHAEQSKKLLADRLKSPLHPELIKNNQEAAKELSEKQESCQQFQSLAIANPLSFKTEKKLQDWSESPPAGFEKPYWKWIQNLYPIIPLRYLRLYIIE